MIVNRDSLVLPIFGALLLTALVGPFLSLNPFIGFNLYVATLLLTFFYFAIGLLIFKFCRNLILLIVILLLGYAFPCSVLILTFAIPAIIPPLTNLELAVVLLIMVGLFIILDIA